MDQKVGLLRIVVASPGDLQTERNALNEVIEELNRGTAKDRGLRIELSISGTQYSIRFLDPSWFERLKGLAGRASVG